LGKDQELREVKTTPILTMMNGVDTLVLSLLEDKQMLKTKKLIISFQELMIIWTLEEKEKGKRKLKKKSKKLRKIRKTIKHSLLILRNNLQMFQELNGSLCLMLQT
jgi:hypothetical protein